MATAKAALTAAAQVGECHPAACRDEQLWHNEIAATIERCAQRLEQFYLNSEGKIRDADALDDYIAAIRKLKDDKPIDPNIVYPDKDLTNVFPEETE